MNLSYYMIKDSMFGVKNCIISFLLLVGFAACQQETLVEATKGGFKVSLVDEQVMVETKATSSLLESPLVENFNLRIERNGSDQPLYNGKITNDLIPAPVGVYTLTASYGENPVLGLDAPYYEGKSEVTIESNKTTPVEIPCKVANALVSVDWANEAKIQKIFPGCKVIVAVGNVSVAIGSENKASRVYFRPNSNLSFTFEWTVNGETKSQVLKSDKLPAVSEAGKHYIIKLDVSDDLTLQITKVASRSETITATIPMEWLPKPKVNGFNDQQGLTELVYTETSDAIPAAINFTAASVIQDVEFTLNFADENLTSLNKKYILSTLSAEDRSALVTAGIELPTLIGSNKSGSINFTNMTAKLLTNAGAEVVNEIKVRVKANNRWNVEESAAPSYKITTVKPEFSVSVKPGNIWTREFTVDPITVQKGDLKNLISSLVYQYSSDKNQWINIDSEHLRVAGLDASQTFRSFYVRAIYRNSIISNNIVMVRTYPQIKLENGDMEKWSEEERGFYFEAAGGKDSPKLRTYYPYSGGNQFWCTNNDFTTRWRDSDKAWRSTVYRYNSFPAVSYTPDSYSGNKAAELRNTAAGRGNKSAKHSDYDFNNVPGELFIGNKIEVIMNGPPAFPSDSYKTVDGMPFCARPKALRFYYKYIPFKEDSWKVDIKLQNTSGIIIAEGWDSRGEFKDIYDCIDIPLKYVENIEDNVPSKIMIHFYSSSKQGKTLPYENKIVTTWFNNQSRTDETLSGSVFTIDDISLVYDGDPDLNGGVY